jgi:hypothetical protein
MQGVPRASFAMLQLWNSSTAAHYDLRICFLPNQLHIYGFYALLLVCTVIAVLFIGQQHLHFISQKAAVPHKFSQHCCLYTTCIAALAATLLPLYFFLNWLET